MNLQRALAILTKFFVVNGDCFRSLSKTSTIEWAQQIKDSTKVKMGDCYLLTQPQHAFLIGEILNF